MCHELKKIGIETGNILVIASKSVTDRQKQFIAFLPQDKKLQIKLIETGQYRREKAMKIYEQALSQQNNNYTYYNGIFCTNDEMALGVHDVMNSKKDFPKDKIVLLGYDAIEESTKLIDSGNYSFKNTVLQDTEKLAIAAVDKLERMLDKEKVNKIDLIEPTLYKEL